MAHAHKDAVSRMRAAQVFRPYGIRGTLQLSVGAGPRPARGRTLCAPTYVQKRRAGEGSRPYGVSKGAFDLL